MDKRYQVFVSSTYADLKEERQHVIQALMEMDCIPAGMELFPAADEEQWEFIKKVINDCDYYLLIIGGRYGSTTDDGISYTEKEFDYAVKIGLRVIALIHGEPDNIPFGKSEKDSVLRQKLFDFKEKVMHERLVKFWKSASDLPGLVSLSLTKTMKTHPAVGWVRANQVATKDILSEINQIRKENNQLQYALKEYESQEKTLVSDIADFDSEFTIRGRYLSNPGRGYGSKWVNFESQLSWRKIFAIISPYLIEGPSEDNVKSTLTENLVATETSSSSSSWLEDQDVKTIRIQLEAYGLIEVSNGSYASVYGPNWKLTKYGRKLMIESRVVRQ